MSLSIRLLEKSDLVDLMACEHAFNQVVVDDPEFGETQVLTPWTCSLNDVLTIIRQRRCVAVSQYESRTLVVELGEGVIVGGFAYEIQDEGYEVVWWAPRPDFVGFLDVIDAIAAYMKGKADRSPKRRMVTFVIMDRDEAHLREVLPQLTAAGFGRAKLRPNYFDDQIDGWQMIYQSPELEE